MVRRTRAYTIHLRESGNGDRHDQDVIDALDSGSRVGLIRACIRAQLHPEMLTDGDRELLRRVRGEE